MKFFAKLIIFAVILVAVLYVGVWQWLICRVYVEPGRILVITAKFGEENPDPDVNRVVERGTKGVWKEVLGEGRHFFNPISYECEAYERVTKIDQDHVGFVSSRSGKDLEEGEFLVEEGYKGILRKPLTPGSWRLNPFAFGIEVVPVVIIQPGYVGCVKTESGKPLPEGQLAEPHQRGIQKKVLQPGRYYLNPKMYTVTPMEIGYRQITWEGVTFPSKDGFTITLDISVVYGLLPEEVPTVMSSIGDVQDVIDKVILPQVESICRIEGSKYRAKDFIAGDTREQFQQSFTTHLVRECKARHVDILIGLVRDINVPIEVREPIQQSKIANEEQLTKEEQRLTQIKANELEETRADVLKGVREVDAETKKLVAEIEAQGRQQVDTIGGEKQVAVAEIMKKVAEAQAERERTLGKANADVTELLKKAEANQFQQMVDAMGDPVAYANYIFATNLPEDLKIHVRYSGEGTFWTDLPFGAESLNEAAARKILERDQQRKAQDR